MLPVKRTLPLCDPRVTCTCVVTRHLVPTNTIGLWTAGLAGIRTLYCVFTFTARMGNAKLPLASVTWLLATGRKPCVYGHGLACRTTWRLALPVPLSVPASTVGRPTRTGL